MFLGAVQGFQKGEGLISRGSGLWISCLDRRYMLVPILNGALVSLSELPHDYAIGSIHRDGPTFERVMVAGLDNEPMFSI